MQLLLQISLFVLLTPVVGMASDAMDTTGSRARRSRAPYIHNAAEPRTHHHDGPTPSFVIIRSEKNPMFCAYALNAHSNDQLALVPWAHPKCLKSGFKIMHCSYSHATSTFEGVLGDPTVCVTGFKIQSPDDNLYYDFRVGLRALRDRAQMVNAIVVREQVPASMPRTHNTLSQSADSIKRRNAD